MYAYGSLLKSDPVYAQCASATPPPVAVCQNGVMDAVLHPTEPLAVRRMVTGAVGSVGIRRPAFFPPSIIRLQVMRPFVASQPRTVALQQAALFLVIVSGKGALRHRQSAMTLCLDLCSGLCQHPGAAPMPKLIGLSVLPPARPAQMA